MHIIQTFVLSIATSLLLACTVAQSTLDGRYNRSVVKDRVPVIIVSIDGKSTTNALKYVDPGRHVLKVRSSRVQSPNNALKTVEFDVAPCTGYVLAAQHENPTSSRWELVTDREFPLPGCQR
jgi:hypothetical protein